MAATEVHELLSPHNALTRVTWLFDCKYGFLISLIVKSNGHGRGVRGLQAMLPIYKTQRQIGFTLPLNEDVYVELWANNARIDFVVGSIFESLGEVQVRLALWKMIPSPGWG